MARALRNRNFLLLCKEHFLFFKWKLEESDLRSSKTLRSPEFILDKKEGKSFLEIKVLPKGTICFYLHNPKSLENGFYVLKIIDKNKSVVKCITKSTGGFETSYRVDLFGSYRRLPPNIEYPILVACISKSPTKDRLRKSNIDLEKRMCEISSDLKNVLEQGLNTDVDLITDGESIKAHRIILQARSPVFRRMFEHDLCEASKNIVGISDIGSATMKRLVKFLYTGIMEKCEFDEAMELYYAADKYEVLSLREDCKAEMLNTLDVSKACRLFHLASRHNDADLKEKVVLFGSDNLLEVLIAAKQMSKEDATLLLRMSFYPERVLFQKNGQTQLNK